MINAPTPHCHLGSLDTGSTIDSFVEKEKELDTKVLTCTDHGTMANCMAAYNKAKKAKLTPILGVEGYFRDDDCQILKEAGITKDEKGTFKPYWKYGHITLHARSQQAYEIIGKRLSYASEKAEKHGAELKPIFTWDDLEEICQYPVTVGTGCLIGVVARHLILNRPDIAINYYNKLRSIVGKENFLVEIFPHEASHEWISGVFVRCSNQLELKFWEGKKLRISYSGEIEDLTAEELAKRFSKSKIVPKITLLAQKNMNSWVEFENPPTILSATQTETFVRNECSVECPDGDLQYRANKFMVELAQRNGDTVIISDDSHFSDFDDKQVQDVRLMASGGNWRFHQVYCRMSSSDSYPYLHDRMGFSDKDIEGWIQNAVNWSTRFGWEWISKKQLPTHFYPSDTFGYTMDLIKKTGRMDWKNPDMVARLKTEINMLHKNGVIDLLPYFFVCNEVNDFLEKNGVLTGAGRGSAAGCLLTYLLGITHINPLKYELSMERFLTTTRIKSGKLPDIDSDSGDRTLLFGGETEQIEVTFDNGEKRLFLPSDHVKTDQGEVSVQEAFDRGFKQLSEIL
jgi:DNA polymerase III alpha subunit